MAGNVQRTAFKTLSLLLFLLRSVGPYIRHYNKPKKKDLLAALEPAAAKFAASPWGKKLAAKTLKANQTVSSKVACTPQNPASLPLYFSQIGVSLTLNFENLG